MVIKDKNSDSSSFIEEDPYPRRNKSYDYIFGKIELKPRLINR